MTKSELAYLVQENILNTHLDLHKKDVNHRVVVNVLDSFFEVLKVSLAKGEHIELRGFGTFETKTRKPKHAINPRTKEAVMVDEHAVCVFRPGKELKQMVKNSPKSK
ncbi:MAG: integration host factor subunit beta [Spirochaetales bacterium]|nr:integration host factor subunit beta [Spirochaetales bacterium]